MWLCPEMCLPWPASQNILAAGRARPNAWIFHGPGVFIASTEVQWRAAIEVQWGAAIEVQWGAAIEVQWGAAIEVQ
jgi:hypothetical protein